MRWTNREEKECDEELTITDVVVVFHFRRTIFISNLVSFVPITMYIKTLLGER
jgi:hypothetical protein